MGVIREMSVKDIVMTKVKVKQEDIDKAKKVIEEQGFKVPVVIGPDNKIISGQDRMTAALELKMGSVPVIVADEVVKPKRTTKGKAGGK